MAIEIEHKFLVANDQWRRQVSRSLPMRQGYLAGAATSSVRVRVCGDKAWLNVKSATIGTQRREYEYEIPVSDAEDILDNLCLKSQIQKVRHFVQAGAHLWEIDEFEGENAGLIVAEIELKKLDEPFERPPWLGEEVTEDPRYYNNNLASHPYQSWKPEAHC